MKVCGAEVGGEQEDTVEGEEETGGLEGGRISPSPPAATGKQKRSGGEEGGGCQQLPPARSHLVSRPESWGKVPRALVRSHGGEVAASWCRQRSPEAAGTRG